ncbi:hypothetical protein [Nonomuraea recticatena]|uniref:hypothetical protein n=1 Tax=Nonomuraea recticatena TaxID=46178 RepID=UPI0031F8C463
MDPDTLRGGPGDVYWRRRMTVLVAVLVVVAVVAWACSSGPDGPQSTSSAKSAPSSSEAAESMLEGLPTVMSTPTTTPTPKPPKPRAALPPSPKPTAKPRRPGMPCEEKDLVLNLQGRQEVYGAGARPNFLVTLVNTGPVMCVADVGPRAMEIRITSGDDRVWSTSDCVSGDGVDMRKLERGIPYVRSLDWDRRRSGGACGGTKAAALPGTYVAVVLTGGLRSPKAVFHLR